MGHEIRDLSRVVHQSQRAADFVELMRINLLARLEKCEHAQIARVRNCSGTVLDLIAKNAVPPMATTDPGALGLLQNLAEAFVASAAPFSAFDSILNAGAFVRAPLRTRTIAVTLAGSGYAVAEAAAKPISRLSLTGGQLAEFKAIGIFVLSSELLKSISAGATDLIANELRRAVGRSSDEVFVSVLMGNPTTTPSTASSGTDAAAFMSDLADALALISYGATSRLFLLVPPALYRRLITMRDAGGAIMNTDGIVGSSIKVTPNDALTDAAVLLDATGIVAASDGVVVDQSTSADLMLDDAPDSSQLTSLFASNLIAMRAERRMGLEVARPDCLCLVTSVVTTA